MKTSTALLEPCWFSSISLLLVSCVVTLSHSSCPIIVTGIQNYLYTWSMSDKFLIRFTHKNLAFLQKLSTHWIFLTENLNESCEVTLGHFSPRLVVFCDGKKSQNTTLRPIIVTGIQNYLYTWSMMPYFFASSANIKKSRSTSFSICANGLPVALASILLSRSRVAIMCRAVISMSEA